MPGGFIVAVRETAAGRTDSQIGVWAEAIDEAKFGIHIHGSDGQSQGEVRAKKIWLVMIIISVAGHRRMPFECLMIAKLKQVARGRVNLRKSEERNRQPHPQQPLSEFYQAVFYRKAAAATSRECTLWLDMWKIFRLTVANLISPDAATQR